MRLFCNVPLTSCLWFQCYGRCMGRSLNPDSTCSLLPPKDSTERVFLLRNSADQPLLRISRRSGRDSLTKLSFKFRLGCPRKSSADFLARLLNCRTGEQAVRLDVSAMFASLWLLTSMKFIADTAAIVPRSLSAAPSITGIGVERSGVGSPSFRMLSAE